MKIKTTKKLNLPELIQFVWENEIYPSRYVNNYNGEVVFNESGKFMTDESFISHNSYFTVEVEEELTEETEFDELWEVYYHKPDGEMDTYKNYEANGGYSTSISQIMQENSIDGDNITLAIYYGSTLIWSKDSGIPEHGVLEVDANDQTT